LQLEREILGHAKDQTQILNGIDFTHLSRLRDDRHLCAHPAYSTEAELFEPSCELVRLHLVNVVNLVLALEPRQGRAIFDVFSIDVQSVGFPTKHEQIVDYVEQRYLQRVRRSNIHNFGVVLAKSLIMGNPTEWDVHYGKIISTLVSVRDRSAAYWPEVSTSIIRLLDNLEPANRSRAIAFIGFFPEFLVRLNAPTRTSLQATVDTLTPLDLADYRVLAGVGSQQFRAALLRLIEQLSDDSVAEAVAQNSTALLNIPELWVRGLNIYKNSRSFRGSEENFRRLILPFSVHMDSEKIGELLGAIMSNGQNWSASLTPSLLLRILQDMAPQVRPSNEIMNEFYIHIEDGLSVREYEQVFAAFTGFGWVIPVH
jgi:hypothetical protein